VTYRKDLVAALVEVSRARGLPLADLRVVRDEGALPELPAALLHAARAVGGVRLETADYAAAVWLADRELAVDDSVRRPGGVLWQLVATSQGRARSLYPLGCSCRGSGRAQWEGRARPCSMCACERCGAPRPTSCAPFCVRCRREGSKP
jgi:hypothetical protein